MHRAVIPLALFAIAAALRIHNAWVAPPLSGFDGPYHGAYVGAIVWEGRFQQPHWFTNHPPLYYAVSAAVWKLLPDGLGAHGVLFALRLINVVCGLAVGAAIWASARRSFPRRSAVAGYALAIALFLPMHIGPSALLGNQIMATALGAAAVVLLLRCLTAPSARNAAIAGAVAGLGVLAKLSVAIIVAVGGLALLVRGVQLHGVRLRALGLASALGLAALLVSSPYFVRNLTGLGAPIDPRVDIWAEVDRSHQLPPRPWQAYIDPDLSRLVDPGRLDAAGQRAVWPVTFASTWFDLFGTGLDVHHPNARRLARVLFLLGGVFSLASIVAAVAAARRRVASAVPLGIETLALLVVVSLASYVAFTRTVPTYGALKGTYLSPAVTGFVLFAALGLDLIASRWHAMRRAVIALLAGFAVAVTTIFWQGGLAPMRVNPADLILRDYSDPPTLRAFRYFVGRDPGRGRPPLLIPPEAGSE